MSGLEDLATVGEPWSLEDVLDVWNVAADLGRVRAMHVADLCVSHERLRRMFAAAAERIAKAKGTL